MVLNKQVQHRTVIYRVNNARLVDFFEGDHTLTLSDTLTKKQENFAAQANRTACGMREKTSVLFSDTSGFSTQNLWIDLPFVQFFNLKMVLIDDVGWVSKGNPSAVAVDVLVLSKSPKITVAQCRERFPCALVVFDASNSFRQVERWRKECETEGWACHDVRKLGAWVWME
jgi:hypothetical protein